MWERGLVTGEEYRSTVRACRDGTRRARAHLELRLAGEVTAKKGFCKYSIAKGRLGKCVPAGLTQCTEIHGPRWSLIRSSSTCVHCGSRQKGPPNHSTSSITGHGEQERCPRAAGWAMSLQCPERARRSIWESPGQSASLPPSESGTEITPDVTPGKQKRGLSGVISMDLPRGNHTQGSRLPPVTL